MEKIIEKEGFKLVAIEKIEFLTPVFMLPASLLRVDRAKLRAKLFYLNLIDDKISEYIPKYIASEWVMCFEKV